MPNDKVLVVRFEEVASTIVREVVVIFEAFDQSNFVFLRFLVLTKIAESSERQSADFTEKVANFVVMSSNLLVEMCFLREHQVTQNTLIVLQLLVNRQLARASSSGLLCRQIVAQITSETTREST